MLGRIRAATPPAGAPAAAAARVDALIRGRRSAVLDDALRDARRAIPATYESRLTGATYLEEIVRKNTTLAAADGTRALTEAASLLDDALASKPNDVVALTYKSLAVRGLARFAPDAAQQQPESRT